MTNKDFTQKPHFSCTIVGEQERIYEAKDIVLRLIDPNGQPIDRDKHI